jgi:hypothetical protein
VFCNILQADQSSGWHMQQTDITAGRLDLILMDGITASVHDNMILKNVLSILLKETHCTIYCQVYEFSTT